MVEKRIIVPIDYSPIKAEELAGEEIFYSDTVMYRSFSALNKPVSIIAPIIAVAQVVKSTCKVHMVLTEKSIIYNSAELGGTWKLAWYTVSGVKKGWLYLPGSALFLKYDHATGETKNDYKTREKRFEYEVLPFIIKSLEDGNWLGSNLKKVHRQLAFFRKQFAKLKRKYD